MSRKTPKEIPDEWMSECVSKHPSSALQAWQSVLEFNPTTSYLERWKNTNVFKGLTNGVRNPTDGSLPQDYLQPSSIRDQYSIGTVVKELKTEEEARNRACIRVYDANQDQKVVKDANTRCSNGGECYAINSKGYLQKAVDIAKERFDKEKKGQVQPGFCIGRVTANVSNAKNNHEFSTLGQQEATIIREQNRQLLHLQGKDDTYDGCAKT